MSLATQIIALATAVGAAMKVLTARVTTLEDASAGTPIQPTQPGDYTFVLGDANTCTPFSALADATIPPNASVAFPIGTELFIAATTAAVTTFVAGAGVTINTPWGAATTAKGDWRCAVQRATDVWDIL